MVFGPGEAGLARQILSIMLVLGLLAGTLWMLRRGRSVAGPRGLWTGWFRQRWLHQRPLRARALEPVDRLILTPQHILHVVRVQGHEVVFATHPRGCTLLSGCGDETVTGASA